MSEVAEGRNASAAFGNGRETFADWSHLPIYSFEQVCVDLVQEEYFELAPDWFKDFRRVASILC
jgi:hypothetical protein